MNCLVCGTEGEELCVACTPENLQDDRLRGVYMDALKVFCEGDIVLTVDRREIYMVDTRTGQRIQWKDGRHG